MEKKAFTLVEMLIVVAIVGIMAFVAFSASSVARRQAQRDIAIDSVVTTLRGQQSSVKSGRLEEEEGSNLCKGMLFSVEEPYVQLVTAPYVAVGDVAADYCDLDERDVSDFLGAEGFRVDLIDRFGGEADSFLILFKPPFARMLISDSTFAPLQPIGTQTVQEVIVRIGLENDDEVRAFRIDTSSGLTERFNENEEESPNALTPSRSNLTIQSTNTIPVSVQNVSP